jgi:CheY-like chemotaxis protein
MPRTILIVDDDEAYGARLSAQLRQHSLVAQYVTSAKAALELLFSVQFDAILTDIYMPDCDGIELLRRVKRQYPAQPVIGMTSTQSELVPVIERLFCCLGGDAFVAKPSTATAVLAVLAMLPQPRA